MTWNDDFGDWQGLKSPEQAPRYRRIASLIGQISPGGRVLDVGCGEAVLRNFIPPTIRYFGIEPSTKAIVGHPEIIHSTAEEFEAHGQQWNCIIFNEVLYYASDPIYLLKKYAGLLCPGGAFIISIFQKPGKPPLAGRLRHWLDRRHPASNVQCTEMVHNFIQESGWRVQHDGLIENCWRIWATYPAGPA